jgi:Asp/Glu/hydantoin racemase
MNETEQIEMGVLRVLTLEDPEEVSLHGRVIERHFPHVSTKSRCIPDHPDGIPTVEAEAEALPYVEELGREMASDVDVLTVSCALDPGVSTLNDELDVPVAGAGASVAAAALARGEKVGTLGLESGTPPNVRDLLGSRLQAGEVVEGAETTNFLTTDAGRDAIRSAVERLADAGCDVVAPSCTGLTTSGVLAELRETLEIPVVDPVLAMAAMGTTALYPIEGVPR